MDADSSRRTEHAGGHAAKQAPAAILLEWGWLPLFLLTVAAALWFRPLMPVDETRYVGVAWEMWRSGSWIVPMLSGEPYSHKPPLLFWLIHAGWAVFGVNELSPRLIGPAFSLASLFLVRLIAGRLWPTRPMAAVLAPWVLLGSVYWLGFATMVMFDQLVLFFVLLGVWGILELGRAKPRGWAWLFLATGLGVLAKGPFALVYLVPLTVSAPWWAGVRLHWRWFVTAGLVGFLGSFLALAWALWAAHLGGPTYAEEILWQQIAGRAVDAFDHAEPFYYYLMMLPVVFLPWTLLFFASLPAGWRGGRLRRVEGLFADKWLLVLLLAWVAVPLLLLSLMSGKLPHYILPMLPAIALLTAFWLAGLAGRGVWLTARSITLMWGVLGLALAVLPWLDGSEVLSLLPGWVSAVGLAIMAMAGVLWRARPVMTQSAMVSAGTVTALLLVHLAFVPLRPAFDFAPFAERLGQWQAEGRSLGFVGKYRAEYDFYGRLSEPVVRLSHGGATVEDFCRESVAGIVIERRRGAPPADALATTRFRSKHDVARSCEQFRPAEPPP
ncbi:glycosyltransferase family 39 protein [Guyparkeria sp. 1SP6A2]|nr:glycosyltransferase family 39 protein [Guyparkeria sp. 1SP6A2]